MKEFFKKIDEKIEKSYELSLWKWILICFIAAFGEELLLEILGRRSIINAFLFIFNSPIAFIYNILIVFFTLTLAILSRKRIFFLAFIFVLWLTCGIVNFVVLGYRITPFSAIDVLMASDVLSMLDVYYTTFQQILLFSLIVIVIAAIVFAYIKTPKIKGRVKYVRNILVCLGIFLVVYVLTIVGVKSSIISDDFANLGTAYDDFGFAYCFSNSVIDVGINKPEGYSEAQVDEILQKISNDTRVGIRKRPNIIIIQLESFIDIDRVSGVNVDKDPVANFNKLEDEYPSGYLTVPSIGAGTANTEFEILTGMSSKLFGAGEYPFKTVLTSTPCESLAQILSIQGFGTHAIHNNKAVFYSRNQVYANLGFDTFTSLEYMYDVDYTSTGWAKDNVLITDIKKCLDSTIGRDFVFTVSVQGHGRYPTDGINTEEHIKVTRDDGDEELTNQFAYYVNQTYEMDQMIGELKKQLDASGEQYVLVLYGDHIPALKFEDGQITKGNDFQTEYVIVNNIGLKIPDKDIYTYELSDILLSNLQLSKGYMQKIHKMYYDEKDSTDFINAIHVAQYDMLYGDKYIFENKEPYEAKEMQMGIDKISVDSVTYENEEITVKGKNFNTYSSIVINDDRMTTEYVDRNTLKILADDVKDEPVAGDIFRVDQIDKEKHSLSQTGDYIYIDHN